MKRILIVLLFLLLLAALALPAAIGWLVQDRAGTALRERWPEAEIDWQRGWTRSSIDVDVPGGRAQIKLRHLTVMPPGLLALDGRITLSEPLAAIELSGSVSPRLVLQLQLDAPSIALQTQAMWQWDAPKLRIEADRNGNLMLNLESRQLLVHDGLGNRLTLAEFQLRLQNTAESDTHSGIELQLGATRLGAQPSGITLKAESVDREALAQLIEAGRELSNSEPDSATAGFAAIGALAAWQQLVAGGLSLELATLELDAAFELQGRWDPGTRRLRLLGGGPEATLLDWSAPLIGLQQSLTPDQADRLARDWLTALQDQPGIRRQDRQLRIDIQRP
ncbi:MAG: hypothetical protein CVV18_00030 [Gammaproteobacteria bacterium HGW-Gammaproteobacteria-8]|nr:MAG: hypothetical protein CVV18_00030 [Gammaproteobacteria bacterium HGW-Gammaproteobacteria-8]